VCNRLADRTEHEAGEASAPSGADDEQRRPCRLLGQHVGRMSRSGNGLNGDPLLITDALQRARQHLLCPQLCLCGEIGSGSERSSGVFESLSARKDS
jgi:hypothetical protein